MIDIKLSSVELTGFDEGQLAPTRGLRYRGHRRLGSHEGGRTKRKLEKDCQTQDYAQLRFGCPERSHPYIRITAIPPLRPLDSSSVKFTALELDLYCGAELLPHGPFQLRGGRRELTRE